MRILGSLVLFVISAPAHASTTSVPEPSALGLFALGVLGVIIGRQGSKKGRD